MAGVALAVLSLLVVMATPPSAEAQSTPFRPVAVVNGSAITGYDISQRAQIIAALGFQAPTTEALQREALDRLIEDRLKLQEGARFGLSPTEEVVEGGLEEFSSRTGLEPDEFRAVMSARGISMSAIDDFVGAEMIWRQVIVGRFSGRIQPSDSEIDAEIALSGGGARAFRVLEIGLPSSENNRGDEATLALAERLSQDLNAGGDFVAAVRTHSRAPSSQRAGEVGWITTDRMPADLSDTLGGMQVGEVSAPLKVAGGYSLLKVVDIREAGTPAAATNDPDLRRRVAEGIANDRTQRLADGLLQELRRDALIELR